MIYLAWDRDSGEMVGTFEAKSLAQVLGQIPERYQRVRVGLVSVVWNVDRDRRENWTVPIEVGRA